MPGDQDLIAFYSHGGRDAQGRTHSEILAWSDTMLEAVHDYIQWLFPLPEPSGVNAMAPLLTPAAQRAFAASSEMRGRLRAAWLRMMRFYGFAVDSDGLLARGLNFEARARQWLTLGNHNHLRLTRILRCLHLAGLAAESEALFVALSALYREDAALGRHRISAETFRFWERARL